MNAITVDADCLARVKEALVVQSIEIRCVIDPENPCGSFKRLYTVRTFIKSRFKSKPNQTKEKEVMIL